MNYILEIVEEERNRQKLIEGWTDKHDDTHIHGELARAASTYAMPEERRVLLHWPWSAAWWKPTPKSRRRELIKAMALLLAEYERIERADPFLQKHGH